MGVAHNTIFGVIVIPIDAVATVAFIRGQYPLEIGINYNCGNMGMCVHIIIINEHMRRSKATSLRY